MTEEKLKQHYHDTNGYFCYAKFQQCKLNPWFVRVINLDHDEYQKLACPSCEVYHHIVYVSSIRMIEVYYSNSNRTIIYRDNLPKEHPFKQ